MHRAAGILLLTVVLAAGCTHPGPSLTATPGHTRDSSTLPDGRTSTTASTVQPLPAASSYAFVEVSGDYHYWFNERMGGVCGFPSPPTIDAANRTIRFRNEVFERNTTRLLVTGSIWDRSLCGVAVTYLFREGGANATVGGAIQGYGNVSFAFGANGQVTVLDHVVPAGQQVTIARHETMPNGERFSANLTITNHGRWPLEGLHPLRACDRDMRGCG